jgi:probable rRNA maturation factor
MPRAPSAAPGLEFRLPRGVRVDRRTLRQVSAHILAREGRPADARLTLSVVDEARMRELNGRFRDTDAATDVLSFPLETASFVLPPGEPSHLGDVVICHPVAVRQATEYGHALAREVAYLFAHGLLHVLGYDHETPAEQAAMRAREEDALASVGLTR